MMLSDSAEQFGPELTAEGLIVETLSKYHNLLRELQTTSSLHARSKLK